jgi:hypothetical protein
MELDGTSGFQLNLSFALGKASNGINPATEEVLASVGSFLLRFPAGSFSRNKQGAFIFQGSIDGVNVNATLKSAKGGWELVLICSGADLSNSNLPLVGGLAIGDDTGSVPMTQMSAQSQ